MLSLYHEERKAVPFIPSGEVLYSKLQDSIVHLLKKGEGIMAFCEDRLIGFIAGYKAKELFGKCKGIYCPVYGHGVRKEYSSSIYTELYKHAADLWVKEEFMTHAITLFAHNKEVINNWFWMGFGMRCVDSIREVKAIDENNPAIKIVKAEANDIPVLSDIHGEHIRYYRKSPIFMPTEDEDPVKDLTEWINEENHHLWIAYDNETPVGYMRIQPDGESFVSENKDIMNITGAYVKQSERKSGVGAMLLGTIQQWLIENGYSLCGVDFESINTTGSGFWNKHFTPYTYSLVRRIDERITANQ